MKKLALFDIDGVVLPGRIGIFAIADYLEKSGLFNSQSLDHLNKDREKYHAGKLAYEYFSGQVIKSICAGLNGQSYNSICSYSDKYMESISDKFFPDMKKVILNLNKTHDIYFITANVHFYAAFFAKYYKTRGFKATILEVKKGKFTGLITKSLVMAKNKKQAIENLLKKYGKTGSMAFGDAEADRLMLSEVEIPICVSPTPGLRKVAEKNGWVITDHLNAEKTVLSLLKP